MSKITKTLARRVKTNPYPCYIYIGNDLGAIKKLLEKDSIVVDDWDQLDKYNECEFTDAFVTPLLIEGKSCGVFIGVFKSAPEFGIIAHESVHLKNLIFEFSEVDRNSFLICDETEAYMVEFLVEEIYDIFHGKK